MNSTEETTTSSIGLTRTSVFVGALRRFGVEIDGVLVGKIGNADSMTIAVAPGTHALQLRTSWCTSPSVSFTAEEGGVATFSCGYNLGQSLADFIVFWFRPYFAPSTFLFLERT